MTVIRGKWSRGTDARKTMIQMAKNVRASLGTPIVWETAHQIVSGVAPRDEMGQAMAIRRWVDAHFRFVKDPIGDELLQTPEYQLADISRRGSATGDCDDAATLTAALAMAIGIPATFLALDFVVDGPGFDHVMTVVRPVSGRSRAQLDMDITRPKGIPTPEISRQLTINV